MAILIPKEQLRYNCDINDFSYLQEVNDRRYRLYGPIEAMSDMDSQDPSLDVPMVPWLVEQILQCNREDCNLPIDQRKPIRLYINSPGGDMMDGLALVNAIELSETPVYTINVGQWCSMAFVIGITGHKRFSLPGMTFLMHDGSTYTRGSSKKVQDQIEYYKKVEQEVIKPHILKCSKNKMTGKEYDSLDRVEYYMLAKDAMEKGFIDEIVTNINEIL